MSYQAVRSYEKSDVYWTTLIPIGAHITRALAQNPLNRIQLTSRDPALLYERLLSEATASQADSSRTTSRPPLSQFSFLPPQVADVTDTKSLVRAFHGASVVVNLVGVLYGDREKFEALQWRGVQNIVKAVKEVNAAPQETDVTGMPRGPKKAPGPIVKVIHFSAIGADPASPLDYWRTKGLAEKELFEAFTGNEGPSVTVIRPSLVFGEGDGFFKVGVSDFSSPTFSLTPYFALKAFRNTGQVHAVLTRIRWGQIAVPASVRGRYWATSGDTV